MRDTVRGRSRKDAEEYVVEDGLATAFCLVRPVIRAVVEVGEDVYEGFAVGLLGEEDAEFAGVDEDVDAVALGLKGLYLRQELFRRNLPANDASRLDIFK